MLSKPAVHPSRFLCQLKCRLYNPKKIVPATINAPYSLDFCAVINAVRTTINAARTVNKNLDFCAGKCLETRAEFNATVQQQQAVLYLGFCANKQSVQQLMKAVLYLGFCADKSNPYSIKWEPYCTSVSVLTSNGCLDFLPLENSCPSQALDLLSQQSLLLIQKSEKWNPFASLMPFCLT